MVKTWKNIAGNLEWKLQKYPESGNILPDKSTVTSETFFFGFLFMMLLCKDKTGINLKFKAHK